MTDQLYRSHAHRSRQFRISQPLAGQPNARVQAGTGLGGPCRPSRAAKILTPRAALRAVLPQDTASASSPACSRLDEAGTKMSSSQPASANAAA
jgi:hypothetical protein